MNKEQIIKMQEVLSKYYPTLNSGGCGLFAYAFVSRVGGKGHRLSTGGAASTENGNINKKLSAEHFIVEYDGMFFDGHGFVQSYGGKANWMGGTYPITNTRDKAELLLAVFEGGWNPRFYSTKIGNNNGDVVRQFLYDFESILDRNGVNYSSRIQ